jgi:hypothetical protein
MPEFKYKLSRKRIHAGLFHPGIPTADITTEMWDALDPQQRKVVEHEVAKGGLWYEPRPAAEEDAPTALEEKPARRKAADTITHRDPGDENEDK